MRLLKFHVLGLNHRTWCGRLTYNVVLKLGVFSWSDTDICGRCRAKYFESIPRPLRCTACEGRGSKFVSGGQPEAVCETCNGTGKIKEAFTPKPVH